MTDQTFPAPSVGTDLRTGKKQVAHVATPDSVINSRGLLTDGRMADTDDAVLSSTPVVLSRNGSVSILRCTMSGSWAVVDRQSSADMKSMFRPPGRRHNQVGRQLMSRWERVMRGWHVAVSHCVGIIRYLAVGSWRIDGQVKRWVERFSRLQRSFAISFSPMGGAQKLANEKCNRARFSRPKAGRMHLQLNA